MKTSKDEQTKKHSRLINSIRSICFTLCFSLIIGICPVYAYPGVVVENVVDVETPGTLWSYIIGSNGTIDVSSSDSLPSGSYKFTWYLGRLSQTISRIGQFTYQNGSYLATIYTYLSNNLPGQWQTLTDIKTVATNSAAANQALLQLVGDQVNINWIKSSSSSLGVYSDLNGTSITLDQPYYDKFAYVKFSAASDANGVLRFYIRMRSYWQNYFYDFIDSVDIVRLDGSLMYSFDKQELYQFYNTYNSIIVLNSAIPMNLDFYLKFTFNQKAPVVFFNPFVAELYYLPAETEDYYKVAPLLYLKETNHSLQNMEVNVEVNDSINVTPIDLDVSIGIDDFQAVNSVSDKLRTWLSTGVSVSALIAALDALDDSFFTLSNRNTIETINNQYTDFYD